MTLLRVFRISCKSKLFGKAVNVIVRHKMLQVYTNELSNLTPGSHVNNEASFIELREHDGVLTIG
jgi:hypothetical protein